MDEACCVNCGNDKISHEETQFGSRCPTRPGFWTPPIVVFTNREPSPVNFTAVQDSGERRSFSTGSVRDKRDGKGRYDLISPIALKRLAVHYENGAKKYGDRNWEKGQPLSSYLDSAIRHLFVYLAGDRSEDHLSAVAWNTFAYIHTEEMVRLGKLPAELNDMKGTG